MKIKNVGVVGAGIMGSGITQACAVAGTSVVMVDIAEAALSRGQQAIADSLTKLVDKGKLTVFHREAAMGRISVSMDYRAFAQCDLVIEAATENKPVKQRILAQVDAILGPQAILATNTSSLSIDELAASTKRVDRFGGLHFFNPVPLMSLVEVISGLATSDATHQALVDFARSIQKNPITVRNSAGFAVNRILCPMINEAIFALQEGIATASDIDEGMRLGCNHPIGPLALADMIGLDTLLSIMEVLHHDFGDPKYRPAPMLRSMVALGRLGRKARRGFFEYT